MSDREADQATGRHYDEVPYPSAPYPQSHPQNLALLASLFGMHPSPVTHARVLELGCSDGSNLIPMAANLPSAEFVGIDLSERQLATGQRVIDRLGLTNITLLRQSIHDIDAAWDSFDYIIAHGVFSWVSRAVQERVFETCRSLLAPQGVAYVSYNTYPGWHLRGMLRDMMLYHCRRFPDPSEHVRQSRALIKFLADEVPTANNPYGMLLQQELRQMEGWADSYLRHDALEEINDPVYFHEYAARAEAHQLQYLGEAEFHTMLSSNLSSTAAATLELVAGDRIEMEQYMDFVRNRMFRQTLLCHATVPLELDVSPERLTEMYIQGTFQAVEGGVEESSQAEQFRPKAGGPLITVRHPFLRAALQLLDEQWPESLSFRQLAAGAKERTPASISPQELRELGRLLLKCFSQNLVTLRTIAPQVVSQVSQRPLASPLARLQATSGGTVTNQLHDQIRLDAFNLRLLGLLNGRRDYSALIDEMQRDGVLRTQNGTADDSDAAEVESKLHSGLQLLARHALLVG